MNVDYWPIGSTSIAGNSLSCPLPDLALNVALDWIPSRPAAVAGGLTNLLAEVLETANSPAHWHTNRLVAGFEKQWRGVTSYLVGVAFTRQIIDELNYIWCAPVSFKRQNNDPDAPFQWFSPHFSIQGCDVVRKTTGVLMPDFLVAGIEPNGQFCIAFVESKGTERALQNLTDAPEQWRRQVENADFIYNGDVVTPKQRIIVGTRVQPRAKNDKTRRVQVRAWNSKKVHDSVPLVALREILRIHYLSICENVGFRATAQLLQICNGFRPPNRNELANNSDLLKPYEDEMQSNVKTAPTSERYRVKAEGHFRIRGETLNIGLDDSAFRLIDSIVRNDDQMLTKELHLLGVRNHQRRANTDHRLFRKDGVIAEYRM